MICLLKRLTDISLATVGLVLLSPLLVLLSLAIRWSSEGPAFFQQTRVGQFGEQFQILKFRTMRVTAENTGLPITLQNDPRITKLGKFLRKTKLDELPQLINVIRGDMSFVGPRPEVPKYVAKYSPEQRKILEAKPGITDPASIAYRHESDLIGDSEDGEHIYVTEIMPKKLEINLNYQKSANWCSDIRVILKTVGVLLQKRS